MNRTTLLLIAAALLLGFGLRGACRPPAPLVPPTVLQTADSLDRTAPAAQRERDSLRAAATRAEASAASAKREADRLRALVKKTPTIFTSDTIPGFAGHDSSAGRESVPRWQLDTLEAAYDSLSLAYQRVDAARVADSTRADRAEARLAVSEAVRAPLAQAVKRAGECRVLGVRTGFCLRFAVVAGPGIVVRPDGQVVGGAAIAAGIRLSF